MSYTKTVWRNNQAPAINADNLNHIEQGIESAHNQIAIDTANIETLTTQVQGNTSNIASEISARQSADSSLQSQIDQIIAPTGEAPSAAEVENARIGDNQVTYDTLGNAIRGQFADVKRDLTQCVDLLIDSQSGLNSSSGLLLLPTKKNDSITVKRTDGQPFAQDDQLRFYDANGAYIDYWGVSSAYGSQRTFTYNNNTPALYVGLTKVGSNVIDYDVTNNTAKRIPSQIDDIETDLSDTKTNLSKVYVKTANIHNQGTDRHGIKIDGSGTITDDVLFKATDYMYVGENNKATIQIVDGIYRAFFYTTNDASGFSRALWLTETTSQTVTLASTEKYLVLTLYETAPDFMVNLGDTLLPYAPYAVAGEFLEGIIDDIDNQIEAVKDSSPEKNVINRFDKATITEDVYLNVSLGTLVPSEGFFASDFIDVADLDEVMCSYTHIVCFYNSNKAFISGQGFDTRSVDNSISRPNNAKYFRFSTYDEDLDYAQIGESVSRGNYVPFGKYTLPNFLASVTEKIVVDASGNGDYTSLTEALYENVDSGVDVIVKAGTYDIVDEYVDLFGQSAVDNMADSDGATFKGFQYGVIIRNRKIEFMPGAHIVCDWSEHTVDGTHRFSALRVDYNAEIIGLDLVSTHTFYAIHDDYGLWDEPYMVKYENCRVRGINLYNANCIGGGCKPYSRHIINNCYFDNGLSSSVVRYHNTNAEGAEPELYVSNSFFNSKLSFNYYGTQTSKMRAYVNNCKAGSIIKDRESVSYNVDNVELYKWCCEETV